MNKLFLFGFLAAIAFCFSVPASMADFMDGPVFSPVGGGFTPDFGLGDNGRQGGGGYADTGQQSYTTDKSWQGVEDLNYPFDVPSQTGEAQPTQTQNYRTMVQPECSTELLAPGSVSPKSFPSGSFNLGFHGSGAPGLGGPWLGSPAPTCSTGSVDLDITNGYF